MIDFIKDGNGITRIVTKEITQRYDYARLLEIKKNLQLKLDENAVLIAECERLGVELPKEGMI